MGKTTKFYLVISLVLAVAGLIVKYAVTKPGEAPYLFVMLPTGAVLFGMFLVARLLEKECGVWEQEQAAIVDKTKPKV